MYRHFRGGTRGQIWRNRLLPSEVVDQINFHNLEWWEVLKLLAEGTRIDDGVLHLSPTFQLLIPGMNRFSIPLHEFMYPNSNLAEKQVFDYTKQVNLGVYTGSSFRNVLNERFRRHRQLSEQDRYNNPIIHAIVVDPDMSANMSKITIVFEKIGRGIRYMRTNLRITVNNQSGEISANMSEPTNFHEL